MKCGKVAGPSGIVAEILKAAGEEGVELARQLTEAVFSFGKTSSDWEESFIQNLYKGKAEALDRGNNRGLKLTDQVMKLLEWVLDFYNCDMVNIDEMQFSFVFVRGTTDAIYIVCQIQEKYITTNKLLYFAFINREKAFNDMNPGFFSVAATALKFATNIHVSTYFCLSLGASVISTYIRTEGFYVKTAIIHQLKCLCIPDCAYTESIFTNFIHISLYDISVMQNILY